MSCGCNDTPLPLGNCNDGCADCPPSNATNLPPCIGGEACDEVATYNVPVPCPIITSVTATLS